MKILKFGGTSMGSAKRIIGVSDIIIESHKDEELLVVVSAMAGVTDLLLSISDFALNKNREKVEKIIKKIKNSHKETLEEIVGKEKFENIWKNNFLGIFKKLSYISEGISLLGETSSKYKAAIGYYGEILSSLLLVETIKMKGIDSRQLLSKNYIKTDSNYLDAKVDCDKSKQQICNYIGKTNLKKVIPVITGFAGSDEFNNTILLSRGGSDYVATIFGAVLNVSCVEIWTDVAGIYSSDPRIIKNPIVLEKIDYKICAELALSGAKVLHPKTISSMIESQIPIYVKSTLEPEKKGTKICKHKTKGVVGMNLNNNNALFHFNDNTMFGLVGYINKITKIFADNDVSIDSIATSEVSFTCSVKKIQLHGINIKKCFKSIGEVEIINDLSKISIVGEGIGYTCEIMNSIFDSLCGYKVYLVSKSASFNNITIFVETKHSEKILKMLHDRLFHKI